MATRDIVLERLRALLKTVDLNTTSGKQIRELLAEELGQSVEEHKDVIKAEVSAFVERMAQKHKRKAEEATESRGPKVPKVEAQAGAASVPPKPKTGSRKASTEGAIEFQLSDKKRASISTFRGTARVDLRDYYQKEGEWLPTKKGISLLEGQWQTLVNASDAVTAALDSEDTSYRLELSQRRSVTISLFRGKHYVNIREYYEKDGELLPGKTGMSLNADQWDALKAKLPDLTSALKAAS